MNATDASNELFLIEVVLLENAFSGLVPVWRAHLGIFKTEALSSCPVGALQPGLLGRSNAIKNSKRNLSESRPRRARADCGNRSEK